MIIDEYGRLFGRFNVIDASTLTVALAIVLGILMVQSGLHKTSGQVVKGESDIEYTMLLHNVKAMNPDLFKSGEKLSITIRNQPRGDVTIVKSEFTPMKKMIASGGGGFKVVPDQEDPGGYDYTLVVKDHAQIAQDGYVTNGVKVKIGSKVELEGFLYRLPAVIADIREVPQK